MIPELVLFLALTFADRTEIVTLVAAETEFAQLELVSKRNDEQAKRHAALVVALGTWPTTQVRCNHWLIKGCFGEDGSAVAESRSKVDK